jgi:GDPmannose 4,6-dehydratase
MGMSKDVHLGNLDARRDWGHAADYVQAMHLMMQQPEAGDYVIATGETHSVREFCEAAFSYVGLDYQKYVKVDPIMYRPAEVDLLLGNASKARRILGWKPRRLFTDLVQEMVQADLDALERGQSAAFLAAGSKA